MLVNRPGLLGEDMKQKGGEPRQRSLPRPNGPRVPTASPFAEDEMGMGWGGGWPTGRAAPTKGPVVLAVEYCQISFLSFEDEELDDEEPPERPPRYDDLLG